MQLAVLGAAGHSPEVASGRANVLAFSSDQRDGCRRLIASHSLTGIDPGSSADAELLANPVSSFDEIGPARRSGEDIGLHPGGNAEDKLWCDRGKRRLWMFGRDRAKGGR